MTAMPVAVAWPVRTPARGVLVRPHHLLDLLTSQMTTPGHTPLFETAHGDVASFLLLRSSGAALRERLLEEKQKVLFSYGVTETQPRRYLARAQRMPGKTGENLLALLERRLDNVVFRLGLAPTVPATRRRVSHGHVRVDGVRVDRAGYQVSPGEQVSLPPGRVRERPSVLAAVERGPEVRLPSYLALDPAGRFAGRVIATPARADVPFPVADSAVVEFYAR